MGNLPEQLELTVRQQKLLRPGQALLVAVSGGVDSMVLLALLHRLAPKHRWRLSVAHLNHRLRGRSSDADERLVRRTAKKLKLPLAVERLDVRGFASNHKLSVEMAARILRHDFLARTATRLKLHTVALAHHADDQNELFLLRLLRGSGGAGLAGMKWRNPSPSNPKIELVRPLLEQTKAALRACAAEEGIPFREDATNRCLDFDRNRVRHELLPLLRRRYQPALDKVLNRVRDIVGAEAEFAGNAAAEWLVAEGFLRRSSLDPTRSLGISGQRSFEDLPVAMQRRAIQIQLLALKIAADFELVERLRLAANTAVTIASLPGGSVSEAQRSVFRDTKGRLSLAEPAPEFETSGLKTSLLGRSGTLVFEGLAVHWSLIDRPGDKGLDRTRGVEFFDADRVGQNIVLRHWQPGDRFQPIGLAKPMKLQDFFINEKIPRPHRHTLVVATTADGEAFWVEGQRISERFKLTKGTIRRLRWHWRRPKRFVAARGLPW